jgi:hypothetical protein
VVLQMTDRLLQQAQELQLALRARAQAAAPAQAPLHQGWLHSKCADRPVQSCTSGACTLAQLNRLQMSTRMMTFRMLPAHSCTPRFQSNCELGKGRECKPDGHGKVTMPKADTECVDCTSMQQRLHIAR